MRRFKSYALFLSLFLIACSSSSGDSTDSTPALSDTGGTDYTYVNGLVPVGGWSKNEWNLVVQTTMAALGDGCLDIIDLDLPLMASEGAFGWTGKMEYGKDWTGLEDVAVTGTIALEQATIHIDVENGRATWDLDLDRDDAASIKGCK
jgi:hypothetical protein